MKIKSRREYQIDELHKKVFFLSLLDSKSNNGFTVLLMLFLL